MAQHQLAVVAGGVGFNHRGRARGVQSGQQDGRFDLGRGHRPMAVGERHRSGLGQQPHLGQFPALGSAGQRRLGEHLDQFHFAGAAGDELDTRDVVQRLGVGQAGQGGDAAGGGGLTDRQDGFLVLPAGFAHRHPQVHEAGRKAPAPQIHHLDAFRHALGEQPRPEIGNQRALGQQRPQPVKPGRRVQQTGVQISDTARHGSAPGQDEPSPAL